MKRSFFLSLLGLAFFINLAAQQADYRPGLFFREDWSEEPKHSDIPAAQKHVSNPDLLMTAYGPGKDSLSKSHHDHPVDDPYYIWSGYAKGNWMVSLKHKDLNVDLSSFAKIKWRTKQAGFRQLHITLKLADGTWLVSDWGDGSSKDWRISEINLSDITWYTFDMGRMSEIEPRENPDLSNVVEIGFTDLMRGGIWFACSRLDWIEVYGVPVKR